MLQGVRIGFGSTQPQNALPALGVLLLSFLGLALLSAPARAEPAQALTLGRTPLRITVLTGPRNDFCYSDHTEAIEKLVRSERDRINKAGGIAGRQIEIQFRNDEGDAKRTVAFVSEALFDPQTLALIGLQNSERAKEVFKELGPRISESGIPWISSIFTSSLIANYPNVYTMRGSQEEEGIPVIAQFVKDRGFTRPAFIGLKGQPAIEALLKGLEERNGFPPFVAKHLLTTPGTDSKSRQNANIDPKDIAEAAEDLRAKNPDITFLFVGGWRTPAFLKELEEAGISTPLLVLGRLQDIFRSPTVSYAGDTYQIARDELPNLYNDRVRNRLFREQPEEWMFHGQRNPDAFERIENECQELPPKPAIDLLSRLSLRAIGIGLEFRDMLAMIADISNSAKPAAASGDVAAVRQTILKGIPAFFSAGKGAFQGTLEDWSFRPTSRTTVGASFIIARPKELRQLQLAPIQYVQLKGEKLRKIPTLYLEIDLKRLYRIDDTEKTFNADFYLSMSDENNPSMDWIEFSNAFLDYKTGARQLTIEPLHEGGQSDTYPNHMKIYKVSGKFMLDPNYNAYPYDVQRFSIDLRPRRGEFPFIVQPQEQPDREFDAEGWEKKDAYVSYDQDFISILDTKNLEQSAVPFYKNSFVWVLKRNAADFYLRTVVPLLFIAIVAYFAIFIPSAHFEAIVTIQVTALLSAVALYITTPKIDSDTATLLDKIFIFNYMMYSLMIGISILRINKFVVGTLHLKRALALVHVACIPIFLVLMFLYIYGAGSGDSQSELEFWPALREGVSRLVVWLGTGSA
jgi:Periplasmic binding protein